MARGQLLVCLQLAGFLLLLVLAFVPLLPVGPWLVPLALGPLGAVELVRRGQGRAAVLACTAIVAAFWALVAWRSGGSASPALIALATLPLFPSMFRDLVGVVGALAGALATVALVVLAERGGLEPSPLPLGSTWLGLLLVVVLSQAMAVVLTVSQFARYSQRVADALAEANERLAEARDLARAANENKSAFLAAMSHELRTPMNAVLGVTGLLLETPLDPRQRDHVEAIREASNALVELVEDILDFSRIEAGQLRLESAPFEPVAVVRQVTDLLRVRAREKGLRLDVDVDPRVPARVLGDGGRFRQVLFNLVGNAVKYTDRGGVVARVSCPERSATEVLLRVDVEDTGIGIAPEDLERIFDRFTQVGGGVEYRAGGTGLGLSIAKHVVDRMGGRVVVRSALGKGSTFTVELRLPVETAAPASEPELPRLPAARVLLAEDNPVNRKVLQAMLDKLGCVGDVAEHGEEALRMAGSHSYDVVLLDVEMPVIDGYTVARRLRDGGMRTPILAITGHTGPDARRRAEDAGMNDVLEKPLRLDVLHRGLARWLGAR